MAKTVHSREHLKSVSFGFIVILARPEKPCGETDLNGLPTLGNSCVNSTSHCPSARPPCLHTLN